MICKNITIKYMFASSELNTLIKNHNTPFITIDEDLTNRSSLEFMLMHYKVDVNFFYLCCKQGFANAARWIYIDNEDVLLNNGFDNELLFTDVLIRGKLDIAEWLLTIKPELKFSKSAYYKGLYGMYAIDFLHSTGKTEIIKWLTSRNLI